MRVQILDAALEVFAVEGYRGTSLRAVAERCGLSVNGVMHYFDSRERLLTEILLHRDRASRSDLAQRAAQEHDKGAPELYVDLIRRGASTPGLIQLFVSLTAAAHSTDHPAHDVLTQRYAQLLAEMTENVEAEQAAGRLTTRIPAEKLSKMLIAVTDGAQMQWLLDPDTPLEQPLETLSEVLTMLRPDAQPAEESARD